MNGVVGLLEGKSKGKVVALRADMDALPITENNGLAFQSVNDGVMHACGHDGHMSILMATAEILSKNTDFKGTVKFIFQGAEEGPPPGEEGGAGMMTLHERGSRGASQTHSLWLSRLKWLEPKWLRTPKYGPHYGSTNLFPLRFQHPGHVLMRCCSQKKR